jgi:outer membrane immunogenic protein
MEVDWLGSARGRIGIASGHWLFYGTGGRAVGHTTLTKATAPGNAPFAIVNDTRTGWTAGAGVENAVSRSVSWRLEYRYTDLGDSDFQSAGVNSQDHSELTFHAVRAGVSVRF